MDIFNQLQENSFEQLKYEYALINNSNETTISLLHDFRDFDYYNEKSLNLAISMENKIISIEK